MEFLVLGVVTSCLDWLFYNHLVVGSISEDEKRTMAKAAEILSRLYIKK